MEERKVKGGKVKERERGKREKEVGRKLDERDEREVD